MLKNLIAISVLLLILGPLTSVTMAAPQANLIDELLQLQPGSQRRQAAPQEQRTPPKPEIAPPDDAPLETLARFWGRSSIELSMMQVSGRSLPPISDKTRERLMDAVIANPQSAPNLLKLLPQTTAVHDRIKHLFDENGRRLGTAWSNQVRAFLMLNTAYFRDDLVQMASTATEKTDLAKLEHEEELTALANLDFKKAEPLLKGFAEAAAEAPRRAALAKGLLFVRYPDGPDADRLNAELRRIVADQNAPGNARVRALRHLLERNWPGRDDWYLELFKDASLRYVRDNSVGYRPLANRLWEDPDRWIPVVAKLVGNPDRAVHDNAVTCLITFQNQRARRDALEPLLPWLLDPKWASDSDRLRLIQSTKNLDLRESIPGLIAVLTQDVDAAEKSYAAEALGYFRDPRAIPGLQQALQSVNALNRRRVITALAAVGGLPDADVVAGLETFARTQATPGGLMRLGPALAGLSNAPLPDQMDVGMVLAQSGPPSESAIALLLARATELQTTDRPTADQLFAMVHRWPSAIGDRDLLQRIEQNKAPAASIDAALSRRETIAKNASEALRVTASSTGVPSGIFAVLSGDPKRELDVLKGSDMVAKRALLASARLARETLPLDAVASIYASGNTDAQRAAEAYLISNDSSRAREILNTKLKGSVILGSRQDGDPGHSSNSVFDRQEATLLTSMKADNADDEVFALLSAAYPSGTTQIIVRRRGDTATLNSQDAAGRRNSRALSAEEFNRLKAFIDSAKIDDLGPLLQDAADGVQYEYVHLTRNAARRVYMNNPGLPGMPSTIYDKLCDEFLRLVR